MSTPRRPFVLPLLVLPALLAGLLTSAVLSAAPASAAARITVRNDQGTNLADTKYATKLTVDGDGFQSVKGGFGGIYLMFGWVSGGKGWKPSEGGVTGKDYRYIPDAEDASNQGYLKFIAFQGGSTSSEAHAVLSNSGSFSLELTVPGPVFQAVDRSGGTVSVDCRTVTCGVITIGAHGVKSPANESFTPVDFGAVYSAAPPGTTTSPDDASPAPGTEAAPGPAKRNARKGVAAGPPQVRTDRLTAVAGNAMAFTGRGFQPGEQVLAILDDGVASIGPMIAGLSGEVAGVISLPPDLHSGTHELRLSGAASGAAPIERFPVRARESTTTKDPAPAAGTDNTAEAWASRLFALVAAMIFLATLFSFILRRRRARRQARLAEQPQERPIANNPPPPQHLSPGMASQ